jgi:hypothetical protein
MNEPNPEEILKNLFGEIAKEEKIIIQLPAKTVNTGQIHKRLREVVYGLLSQDSLTKEQAVLLAALVPLCPI